MRFCKGLVLPEKDPSAPKYEPRCENPLDYRAGGYLFIRPGDEFEDGRYTMLEKLGWGHFAIVWVCYDKAQDCVVAVKVHKSSTRYELSAWDEIKFLRLLEDDGPTETSLAVKYFHYFVVEERVQTSQNQRRHVCIVFELLGNSLLSLIERCNYRGCPLPLVKSISTQILRNLEYIHEHHTVHGNMTPENILYIRPHRALSRLNSSAREAVQNIQQVSIVRKERHKHLGKEASGVVESETMSDSDDDGGQHKMAIEQLDNFRKQLFDLDESVAYGRVKIIDFGHSCLSTENVPQMIQTPPYRCPEVILGLSRISTAADIWSAACIIFELITGDYLFTRSNHSTNYPDEDHLAQMIELLGSMPSAFALRGVHSMKYFNMNGSLLNIHLVQGWSLRDVFQQKYGFSLEEADSMSSFLLPMLSYEPADRATATDCLRHSWITSNN